MKIGLVYLFLFLTQRHAKGVMNNRGESKVCGSASG